MALRLNVLRHVLTVIADIAGVHSLHTLVVQSRLFLSQFNAREVIAEISSHKAEDAIARKTVKGFAVLLTEPTADDFSHNGVKN